jgi:plasmid replication initiation protein
MTNLTITKHNSLINASYRLSTMEMRVVLYGLSLINPTVQDFPIQYKIDIKKFAAFFKLDANWLYQELKSCILDKFWEREFSYIGENNKIVKNRWLIQVAYKDTEALLEIAYNPMIKQLLQNMKANFTSYNIARVAPMKSAYSIRLYEVCIMELKREWQNKTEAEKILRPVVLKITVDKLRYMLELVDKYKVFRDFKIRVLDKIKLEINKHSDIRIKYEVIKRGRTPYEIEFTINKKSIVFDKNEAAEKKFEIRHQLDLALSKGSKGKGPKALGNSLNVLMANLSDKLK